MQLIQAARNEGNFVVLCDYTDTNPAPWYEFRNHILELSLSEDLTVIGARAFAECSNLSVVKIPGSVQIIAEPLQPMILVERLLCAVGLPDSVI